MESGVHASLHPNCHHQTVYAKLNLKIEHPLFYEQLVWNYKNTQFSIVQLKPSTGRNYFKIKMSMSSYTFSARPCLEFLVISF